MESKNWYIGGLGIPKPHKMDRLEWITPIGAMAAWAGIYYTGWYVYDHYGKAGLIMAGIIYFIVGYSLMYIKSGGWKNYREGQKDEKLGFQILIFVMGFLVLLPLIAAMWPLFLGVVIEEKLRGRKRPNLNGNHT